jgi:hypothetical protein
MQGISDRRAGGSDLVRQPDQLLGAFFGADAPASNTLTRGLLGWEPTQPGLIEDLDEGHYFQI